MTLSERPFLQAMRMRHEAWINRRSPHVAAAIRRAKLKTSCAKSKNKSLPHNDNVIELALLDRTGRSLCGSGAAPQPPKLGAQLSTASLQK
ncbi:hypothetical protein [Methylorubrum sp. GM97]|jgi:hypothetical protein|uniref:hypothetical protein n=1 Tax=Methylorubrum sp. GM97 TaxID=2938232 RepID=UPI0021C39695|nr:hypothetical protein [Methylorubrum sp. GM97]